MAKDSLKTRKQRFDYYRDLDVDIHLLSPGQKKHHHPIAVLTRDWSGMIARHVEDGGNLGFAPGNRYLIIDVDVKRGKTGPAQLADFLKFVGLPPNALKGAPRITTPSGGRSSAWIELVYTSRLTPAWRAASSTLRVPSTFTSLIRGSGPGIIEMIPARW